MSNIFLENLNPELAINLILARLRNICYYRAIDSRPRAQYMHVFRNIRADVKLILNKFPESLDPSLKNHLINILKIIPFEIKTEDCSQVANNLSSYLLNQMNIDWRITNYN